MTNLTHGVNKDASADALRGSLRLHDCRHTWATQALESGKNIRWVSDQLGHSDPAFTLRTYTHVLHQAETDLSFVDFSTFAGSTRRHPDGTQRLTSRTARKAPPATMRRVRGTLARREGFEPPTLRFEVCFSDRPPQSEFVQHRSLSGTYGASVIPS